MRKTLNPADPSLINSLNTPPAVLVIAILVCIFTLFSTAITVLVLSAQVPFIRARF